MSIADNIRNRSTTLDSLDVVDQKQAKELKVLESLQIKEAKVDSLNEEIAKNKTALAEMTTKEKVSKVPIVKGAKWLGENATWLASQAVFDAGATVYNLIGTPLNTIGGWFGYNPGFSGERVMMDWYGDYVNKAGKAVGMDVGVAPIFDEDTAGALPIPWLRGHAPEGGEFTYEQESKQKQAELEQAIKKIEEE